MPPLDEYSTAYSYNLPSYSYHVEVCRELEKKLSLLVERAFRV